MPTINVSLPSDGDTIDAADYNTPITTIVNAINGNLDGDNLDSTASFVMDSLTANSVTIAGTAATQGWTSLPDPPNTVTANGNRSYNLVFNSNDLTDTLSPGMRIKATRTVTAPTQCADLESGSSHYFNRASGSVAGMTFTDDFAASAWVKLESYASGCSIVTRYNGTSGWQFEILSNGTVQLVGRKGAAGNYSLVASYQSLPLNKWVHVAAQLDMSAYTATTTTSYIMIDGVNVPAVVSRAGTNPTDLTQAGNLEIGSTNGGTVPMDGKIAQVAIYSAKVTQATILASMSQTLTGSETSLVSAYTLNNSLNDLSANANNLTANGGALATATDTPFAGGSVGTTEYGIVTAAAFSTNTTLTVQVPEGYALPTSGGISAVSYSINKIPYGFPSDATKWEIMTYLGGGTWTTTSNATYGAFQSGGYQLVVPVGSWRIGTINGMYSNTTTGVYFSMSETALTGLTAVTGHTATPLSFALKAPSAGTYSTTASVEKFKNVTSVETYVMYTVGATTAPGLEPDGTLCKMYAVCAYL